MALPLLTLYHQLRGSWGEGKPAMLILWLQKQVIGRVSCSKWLASWRCTSSKISRCKGTPALVRTVARCALGNILLIILYARSQSCNFLSARFGGATSHEGWQLFMNHHFSRVLEMLSLPQGHHFEKQINKNSLPSEIDSVLLVYFCHVCQVTIILKLSSHQQVQHVVKGEKY